ncbi:hypothetical protein [Clostridium sp. LP20]|uniref:hypothetical protein n=1 Tax=Clostridium sp. LP20 TaxID=3418665 RepID=UPI003EE680E6
MKKLTISAIIVFFVSVFFVGCSGYETEILSNNTQKKINGAIMEFEYSQYKILKGRGNDNYQNKILGYYQGSLFFGIYNYEGDYLTLNYPLDTKLYLLMQNEVLTESSKRIDEKYTRLTNNIRERDFLFSTTGFLNWRTGEETEIIDNSMKNSMDIKTYENTNIPSDDRLMFVKGTKDYVIYSAYGYKEEQFMIVDIDTKESYIGPILSSDTQNTILDPFDISQSIVNRVFYDNDTKSFYSFSNEGIITKYIVKDGRLVEETYDDLKLEEGTFIYGLETSGRDIYFLYGVNDRSGVSKNLNRIKKYTPRNKLSEEVFKSSWDTHVEYDKFYNGYFVLSKRRDDNGLSEKNKYYIATLVGKDIKIIREISEDDDTRNYEPYIYVNEDENVVVVDSIINKGVMHKYQVFEINSKGKY